MPTKKTVSAAVLAAAVVVVLARRCDGLGVERAVMSRQRMAVARQKQRARRRGGRR